MNKKVKFFKASCIIQPLEQRSSKATTILLF